MKKDIVDSSPAYKSGIVKVSLAILFFLLIYLLLIAFSLALLAGCIYAAISLVAIRISGITMGAAIGLVVLGVMFFVFLIKFIFARYKESNTGRIQIKEKDHPRLFELIYAISDEVGTTYPKKVFLSHDVNAAVFFNSSFFSLFLPVVRKNLDIGLGMVNSLTSEEMKAILAHEFGHFSQKSMRLGSYVYTVNRVIYNLAYSYDKWDITLEKWARTGGVFGLFAIVTHWLVELVRSILRKSYSVVNIFYLKLSREMEFHADRIAGSVTGKESAISALRRMEFSAYVYAQTIARLNDFIADNKYPENLYEIHRSELYRFGNYLKLDIIEGLPVISGNSPDANTIKSRVYFKDQWATHPSLIDRIENLSEIESSSIEDDNSQAWSYFDNIEYWQKKLTLQKSLVEYGDSTSFKYFDTEEYQKEIQKEQDKFKIDEKYMHYYDDRVLFHLDIEELSNNPQPVDEYTFSSIYNSEVISKFDRYRSNDNDLHLLHSIKNKEIKIRIFEFDNKKYKYKNIGALISQLEKELEEQKKELQDIEKRTFLFNLQNADRAEDRELLIKYMIELQRRQEQINAHSYFVERIGSIHMFIQSKGSWDQDEIRQLNGDLEKLEKEYSEYLRELDLDTIGLNKEQLESIESLLNGKLSFVRASTFYAEGFNLFANMIFMHQNMLVDISQLKLKELTDFQLLLCQPVEQ